MNRSVSKNGLLTFLMLYFYFPRFDIPNSNHFVHLILGIYMTINLALSIMKRSFSIKYIMKRSQSFRSFIMAGTLFSILSFFLLFIKESFSISNLLNSARPLFFILVVIYIASISINSTQGNINRQIIKFSKIFLITQSFISLLQLFNINILDAVYLSTKSFPLGSLVRVTGTLNNPNLLGWFTLQFAIMIIVFEESIPIKITYFSIALILIIFTGSRSMLLISPISLLLLVITYYKIVHIKRIPLFRIIIVFTLFLIGFLVTISIFSEYVPYLSQILDIFKGKSLRSIASFNKRFEIWSDAVSLIVKGTPYSILFGHDLKYFDAIDNDVLYSILRYGIVGLILNTSMILISIKKILSGKSKTQVFIIEYFVIAIIIGMQAETFIGWIYPVLIYVFYGVELSKDLKGENT